MNGKRNVMCFKNMANYIVNEKWFNMRNSNMEKEVERIVLTAARLIREEIRNISFETKNYPDADDIKESISEKSKWKPPLLNIFLSSLIPNEIKKSSLSQCIIKAAKPRSALPPILFGLGVECDHIFGSKWLINELFQMGFLYHTLRLLDISNQLCQNCKLV